MDDSDPSVGQLASLGLLGRISRLFDMILTLVVALTIMMTGMLLLAAISGERWSKEPVDKISESSILESRTLDVADLLQHVQTANGERCAFCHDDKPVAPVRISCQHLFCCGCAHALLGRIDHCPLCLQKPDFLRDSFPTQSPRPPPDVGSRLSQLYYLCCECILSLLIPSLLIYLPYKAGLY